jgi:hypothetical protein
VITQAVRENKVVVGMPWRSVKADKAILLNLGVLEAQNASVV